MATDAAALLGQVTWSDEAVPLAELLKSRQLPLVVRVAKGQYLSVGPGGLSGAGVHSTLLLTSGGRRRRLVAHSIKFKDSRRVVPVGPKLLIPDAFDGYFEILSEEGRSVRAIESVAELSRRFPDSCIARDSCKAYVSKSDSVDTITERSRTIQPGETLVLVGEVTRARGRGPSRFLRCFDSGGENVYLPLEQKVKFSAVAKEENISGVHSVTNLLNKRLPLNVRLVSGRPPDTAKAAGNFAAEIRLHAAYDDELVVASPLHKDGALLAMPPTAPLRVQVASNADALSRLAEFERLCERAARAWTEAADRIHAFDVHLPAAPTMEGKAKPTRAPRPRGFRRSMSSPVSRVTRRHSGQTVDEYDEIDQIYDYVRGFAPLPRNLRQAATTRSPERRQAWRAKSGAESAGPPADQPPEPPPIETIPTRRPSQAGERPSQAPPPPVESVPTRRLLQAGERPISLHPGVFVASLERSQQSSRDRRVAEKRAREPTKPPKKSMAKDDGKQAAKLFAKSGNTKPKPRFFRHKSASPLKSSGVYYPLPNSAKSSGLRSPLFNIRYKSLNNLAMDFDTLTSSQSGGKTSGDSGDSAAIKAHLPEKKSKKLGRPKSMSNLLWDPARRLQPAMEMYVKPNLITDQERKLQRLEPGVYKRRNSTVVLNNKLNSQKKIGTLYL